MKKLLSLILSLGFILTLSACDMNMSSTDNGDRNEILGSSGQNLASENISSDIDSKFLTREEAIEIALNHAGLAQADVFNLTAELDKELTHSEWDVEFDKDNYEYTYEINATTGEIIRNEKEID